MANLPTTKRFVIEDFKDQRPWIDKLFYPLNKFLTDINSALANNLTVSENLSAQVSSVTVQTSSSVTTGASTLANYVPLTRAVSFAWLRKANPTMIFVGNVIDSDPTASAPPYAVQVAWSYASGVITITGASGLLPSKTYSLKLMVLTS